MTNVSPAEVTTIIQVHYRDRVINNLDRVLRRVGTGSFVPAHTLLWCNRLEVRDIMPCIGLDTITKTGFRGMPHMISSTSNTLLGRYAAALMSTTPYIFVQDDDLEVGVDTVRDLVTAAAANPTSIVGVTGRDLALSGDEPYTGGWAVAAGPADVVLGRCWAAHKAALLPGIGHIMYHNIQPGRADDILFSLAGKGLVIEANPGNAINNLEEHGVGLSHEEDHFKERNQLAKRWREELRRDSKG